jgi:hypothetical protein
MGLLVRPAKRRKGKKSFADRQIFWQQFFNLRLSHKKIYGIALVNSQYINAKFWYEHCYNYKNA